MELTTIAELLDALDFRWEAEERKREESAPPPGDAAGEIGGGTLVGTVCTLDLGGADGRSAYAAKSDGLVPALGPSFEFRGTVSGPSSALEGRGSTLSGPSPPSPRDRGYTLSGPSPASASVTGGCSFGGSSRAPLVTGTGPSMLGRGPVSWPCCTSGRGSAFRAPPSALSGSSPPFRASETIVGAGSTEPTSASGGVSSSPSAAAQGPKPPSPQERDA
ncbi:UNVERIFIED_CONTAM: hypothetical protein FKN15_011456 [Acipenser sinensis]